MPRQCYYEPVLRTPLLVLSSLAVLGTVSAQDAPAPQKPAELDVVYGKSTDGQLKVAARLIQQKWDPSDPRPTCKVFHQVYAPDGTLLTKGLGGQFEHHRGLFVGWNRTLCNGKSFDFWHCNRGERQTFGGTVSPSLLSMGKRAQVAFLHWVAPDGEAVIHELRGLEVVAHEEQQYVLHMRVQCRALAGDVQLTGDPQHAGQQFRALQQFAEKGAKPVLYLRPPGAKKHGNDVWTKCDWIAGVLRLPVATYTVLRIESPHNPGKTKWSTRPYGRFGATRKVKILKGEAMRIDQIYVIANGARDGKWCADQAAKWRKWQGLAPDKQKKRNVQKGGE